MSNFETFDRQFLERLLDGFLPGVLPHLTPISYRAWTPDIFMFLFRTTGTNGEDHYFVAFEYDHVSDEKEIYTIINEWIGVEPLRAVSLADDESSHEAAVSSVYKCRLYEIPRPNSMGYWSENIIVNKGDDIDDSLQGFTPEQKWEVYKVLGEGLDNRSVSVYKNGDDMDLFFNE